MRPISEQAIVALWERGRRQQPLERALTLLSARLPQLDGAALADLRIGQRNAEIFALYQELWGRSMQCESACPACKESFAFEFDTAGLAALGAPRAAPEALLRKELDGWELEYRLPSSRDLAYVRAARSAEEGSRILLGRCLHSVRYRGGAPSSPIPESIIDALADAIAEADPLTELLLELTCPDCRHTWQADLDIADFSWRELTLRARRLLVELHAIASQYGWTEEYILAMSAERRQSYMELIGR